jgi:hypothetical protein
LVIARELNQIKKNEEDPLKKILEEFDDEEGAGKMTVLNPKKKSKDKNIN